MTFNIHTNDGSMSAFCILVDVSKDKFQEAALKAIQAAKTTSPLILPCQKALNDISTRHAVGLYWVPRHAGVRGIEIADKLASDWSVQRFVGPEPFLGVSRQNIRRKMKCWMENQHLVLWRGPCSTQISSRIDFWP
jgi:hypothetical protein